MAGMLVPGLRLLPPGAWEIVFAGAVAWFTWQAIRAGRSGPAGWGAAGHWLPRLTESGAMLFMLLAVPAVPAAGHAVARMGGSRGEGGLGVLAFLLVVVLSAYAGRAADRLTAPCDPAPAPRLAGCSPVAAPTTMWC